MKVNSKRLSEAVRDAKPKGKLAKKAMRAAFIANARDQVLQQRRRMRGEP